MRVALSSIVLVLFLAGCSGSASLPEPSLTAADLYGTVWVDTCSDTVYWIQLKDDGTYDYSTSGPENWTNDGTDTWSLEGSALTLSWSDGYRVVSFDLSGGLDGRIDGTSSRTCDGVAHIERQS